MLKFFVTGLVLYFMYKYWFQPSLNQGKKQEDERIQKEEVEIRRPNKNSKEEGEFIDYEEVE